MCDPRSSHEEDPIPMGFRRFFSIGFGVDRPSSFSTETIQGWNMLPHVVSLTVLAEIIAISLLQRTGIDFGALPMEYESTMLRVWKELDKIQEFRRAVRDGRSNPRIRPERNA
jgi:hypothetical protein